MAVRENFNKFLMLMYKGFLLRKRHYIVSILEIVITIFVASIPVIILSLAPSPGGPRDDYREYNSHINATFYDPFDPYTGGQAYYSNTVFLYAPNDTATRSFFNDTFNLFLAKRGDKNYKTEVCETEADLEDRAIALMTSNTVIGTIFSNLPTSRQEMSLDYKIRYSTDYSDNFYTNVKYQFLFGPRSSNAYKDTLFLSWQTAIEQSFIGLKTNKTDFQVMMQRFPYPAYDKDSAMSSLMDVICMCFVHSFFVFLCIFVKRIVEEKANRSKELLKMMGMTDLTYWISTFCNHFVIGLLLVLIITILYTAPLPNTLKVLENSNFFLVFIIFLIYIVASMLMCMVVSILFNRVSLAVGITILITEVPYSLLFGYFFSGPNFQSAFFSLNQGAKLAMCLLPNGAILLAFKCFSALILTGEGLSWSSLSTFAAMPDVNLGMVMGMILLSCVIYSVLLWYLDAVWPWQFGVPKPFYFPVTKSYWCPSSKTYCEEEERTLSTSSEFFEADPVGSTPGIVIRNLAKVFKSGLESKAAVDGISLNIYSGQITALLGRNGAGKTTTVNMLTGLFTPSEGSASISGYDIRTDMDSARKSLGICPQDNIHFPTLTVEEHLKIVAGMKGVRWSMLTAESDRAMRTVNLLGFKDKLAKDLSGGTKRKLGLALALIGDSKVLFLDEPTSGMDPESRRWFWDILLGIRHDKTIVLTTHYMEEADILGDRIAIMVDGKLRCCGSSLFLKQKFGTGYHLNVARDTQCDIIGLTALLKHHVPHTVLTETFEKELRYKFDGEVDGTSFVSMFKDLEVQKSELGVSSFGMTVTTMDDVFLKVNTLDEKKLITNSVNGQFNNGYSVSDVGDDQYLIQPPEMETGFRLFLRRVLGIFLKRAPYARRHLASLIYQLIIPFLLLCLFLYVVNSTTYNSSSPPALRLDLESVYGPTDGVYQSKGSLSPFAKNFLLPYFHDSGVDVRTVPDAQQYVLDVGTNDLTVFLKKLLVGGSDDGRNFTAWYNGEPFHTLPMSLNMMHTSILRFFSGNKKASISVTNAPLPIVSSFMYQYQDGMSSMVKIMAAIFMPLSLGYMAASYVAVPIQECASKAKLLQLMTGVSSFTYWLAMFLWDIMTHSIVSVFLLVPFAMFAGTTFFTGSEIVGTAFLLLLLFGWSCIPMAYIISRWLKKPSSGYTLITCINFVIGLIATLIFTIITQGMYGGKDNPKVVAWMYVFRLLPIFSVSWGFCQLLSVAVGNTFCDSIPPNLLKNFCVMSPVPQSVRPCCKDICGDKCFKPMYPIVWDSDGCGRELLFLFLDGVFYFAILLFLETGLPGRWWDRLLAEIYARVKKPAMQGQVLTQNPTGDIDLDVMHEAQRIENSEPRAASEESLVAVGLTKCYRSLCAVDNLTFAVHKQECFGLLGVNGAGKTSTFMMLSGDILPSKGNAFIDGYSLQNDLKKFQSFIGYCPQFDALIDRLTGREMLRLFATIRGIPAASVERCVSTMIKNTDLQEYADKQTQLYSGGNKRKLSLAIALIGCPPLILLDEPTSGVDPVSRRKIWHILSQARQVTRAAVVLCTHSMEECEALCSRLSIMVKGKFRCLGSLQHLKSKFGQGFTVVIKFKDKTGVNVQAVEAFKNEFLRVFPSANLKDFHQGMLNYHVTDPSIPWSSLFGTLEQMKLAFDLDDYLISGTTLEQIFLAFARDQ